MLSINRLFVVQKTILAALSYITFNNNNKKTMQQISRKGMLLASELTKQYNSVKISTKKCIFL